MISTVVRDYANAAERALFSLKTSDGDSSGSSTGLRALDNLYANQKKSNWKSYAGTPVIALGNTLIETITPLLQTIESVVFASFSILATFYYLVRLDTRNTGKAARMTMINVNESIRNVVRFIGKVALSPLYLITQLFVVAKAQKVRDTIVNHFDREIPGSRNFLFRNPQDIPLNNLFACHVTPKLLKGLYSGVIKIAQVSPLAARVIAVFAAFIDTILEIITPLITTIEQLVISTLGAIIFVAAAARSLTKKDIPLIPILREIACRLSFAVESIARAVSMAALAPITLIAQTAKIIYDPLRPDFIMFSIYFMCHKKGYEPDQRVLTRFGMRDAVQGIDRGTRYIETGRL